jgi:xylulose-5-phosphate/fructose-6-phosphate phosphoketolase
MLLTVENTLKRTDEIIKQHSQELQAIHKYQQAANYLSAAQMLLLSNVQLKKPLRETDLKPYQETYLHGFQGINLIYAHLNRLITRHNANMSLLTGSGHATSAILANLYLEGSLQEFYRDLNLQSSGVLKFIRDFSSPSGFHHHLDPAIPGSIFEGGFEDHVLSTAYGAILDNPDMIVACLIGDYEAETGSTANAWQCHKFIDPIESGAVLPIVYLERGGAEKSSMISSMSDPELEELFISYGYAPVFVSTPDIHAKLLGSLDWAYHEIRKIQESFRQNLRIENPRWPLLLIRIEEPKGQLPKNPTVRQIEEWLRSFEPEALFDEIGINESILKMCPRGPRRMGMNPHTYGGSICHELTQGDLADFQINVYEKESQTFRRGTILIENSQSLERYLKDLMQANPCNIRIFSPMEGDSRHSTFMDPFSAQDHESARLLTTMNPSICQGWFQGYTETGRHGLFVTTEHSLNSISCMIDQYVKYLSRANQIPWRLPVPSLNYLIMYPEEDPGFLSFLLNKKGDTVRLYFPPDANCLTCTINHCLQTKNLITLTFIGKQPLPQWLSMDEAINHCRAGGSMWKWASTEEGVNPDVVLAGIGDQATLEVMAAAQLLRTEVPRLRVRVVNIKDLLVLENDVRYPCGMDQEMFDALFTPSRPVIFNFHGYASTLQQILFHRGDSRRFHIHGHQDEGISLTPFDQAIRNGTSRFHLILQAIRLASHINPQVAANASELITFFNYKLRDAREYIHKKGKDPEEISKWQWR